jgi:hypothetical protein
LQMKRYTHPPKFQTLISLKEGSTVNKEWFFLRSRLNLDGVNPEWERTTSKRSLAATASAQTSGRTAIRRRGERLRNGTSQRTIRLQN